MKIETKFNIGDYVYFIDEYCEYGDYGLVKRKYKLGKGEIGYFECSMFYFSKNISITYDIKDKSGLLLTKHILEKLCFKTKEDAQACLKKLKGRK